MDIRLYETSDPIKAVCLLTEKLYKQGKKIQIVCENPLMVSNVDQALWQFKQLSFLPHMTDLDRIDPFTQPIFITSDMDKNLNQADIIICCNTVPHKVDCEHIVGICDSTSCSSFKTTYIPTQHFVQTPEGNWKQN